MSEFDNLLGDNLDTGLESTARPTKSQAKRERAQAAAEEKVCIILEDNDQIPPGGQFVQVNGRSFLIQPGHPVEVPRSVVDVLDHAVMSVPVVDAFDTVIGYKDRLRFPYRIVSNPRAA